MKNYFFIIFIINILFVGDICAQEKQVKIFPFKSAIIEYKYEAGLGGTHVKYIDDYGYKQTDIIKQEIKIGGDVEKKHETIILIGSRAYTVNYQDTTVAIGRNSTYGYYLQNKSKKPNKVTEALIKVEGFIENGTKNFLGKECKVWKADKAKKLTWNGVELKSTVSFFMMMVEKAVSIKVDVELPKNIFNIPQGFKYISSDVYQGYSGLDLKFDKSTDKRENENIKVEFNSSSLGGTDNIPFYTQHGDELIQDGVNDYNKVDLKIIKSQISQLKSEKTVLEQSSTLIFYQEDGYGEGYNVFGKVQINKIGENGFTYRYMVFGDEDEITGYSNNVNNALSRIFDISPDKNNWKLIFKPKKKTKCVILGW